MRRPMKPFVTEYKPSTRRQISATRHPQPFATEPSATESASPKPSETGRFDAASRTDDSYEAALRAADALFSPQRHRPDHGGGDGTDNGGTREAAGRGSGRILRVLDEPSPEPLSEMMSALEREHAPKRRGRKPGSKNRPKADKAASPDAATPFDARAFDARAFDIGVRPTPLETSGRDQPVVDPVADLDASGAAHGDTIAREHADGGRDGARHDGGRDDPEAIAPGAAGAAEPVAGLPSRERRRFSWVRTKLKPGQEWKRRLPKVCW